MYMSSLSNHLSKDISVASRSWPIMNNAAVTRGVHISLQINVFKFLDRYPEEALLNSTVTVFSIFFRRLHTVFHSGMYQFTFPPAVNKGSVFFLQPLQHLLLLFLLIIAIHTGVKWYLIVVLIFIFLMSSKVEHLFLYLVCLHT
uniref:Uncharacterized protein n=1 Tax=Myotis myotis TaxID=51298 RepID=A0A7J7TTS5_MYOMY|nr:hypothetical protein mMyoMyo1_008983 [Myotis myotis]